MLSDLSDRLGAFLRRELGEQFKSVIYGAPEMIPTTAQPALLYNAETVERIPVGATGGTITITYTLSALSSQMADCETAAQAAQSLLWSYDRGRDVGLLPALIRRRNNIVFVDSMDRPWVLSSIGQASFDGMAVGRNYLGVCNMEITIQTSLRF